MEIRIKTRSSLERSEGGYSTLNFKQSDMSRKFVKKISLEKEKLCSNN